ncbi:hypothetical protein [Lentzea cavernae]|uniref:hypothetical protein n=1 Tax=Lentzea cavernae TaxID=2020703 RepID=UPI00174AA1E3|nr:hypothetical protein [Lentzea cavernae]
MLTAIIAGGVALIVATIAALATLRAKKLDLIGQSEQRRAEALKRGYDLVLASYDLIWHYRCHLMLSELGHDPPFDWDKDWKPFKTRVELTGSAGIDLLQENSLHIKQLSPALIWLSRVAFEGVNLKGLESLPEDYEEARGALIKFSRIDSRIDKPVSKSFWKRVSKRNKPQEMAKLTSEEALRRMYAIVNESKNPGLMYIYQSGSEDNPDDNPLVEYLRSFDKYPPILATSLAVTASRIAEWRKAGVIDYDGPCQRRKKQCYEELRLRLA